MANKLGLEMSIVLQVSGFLIAGTLVSGPKYFERFASDFAREWPNKATADMIQEAFSQYGEIYKNTGDDLSQPATYIHLENARFFHHGGKPIPMNHGIWWRGRLSEVSGFFMGSISHEG